jgi:uncharacterized cupin superfamily protein
MDYFFPDQDEDRDSVPPNGSAESSRQTLTASEMRDAQLNGVQTNKDVSAEKQLPAPVVHAGVRPVIELNGGVTWARLTALAERGAEFLEITYAPGAMSGINMSHHEGREFGLILEGQLVVELGFETYTLNRGDSIIFESTVPHRLMNRSDQAMRAVWVVLNQQ